MYSLFCPLAIVAILRQYDYLLQEDQQQLLNSLISAHIGDYSGLSQELTTISDDLQVIQQTLPNNLHFGLVELSVSKYKRTVWKHGERLVRCLLEELQSEYSGLLYQSAELFASLMQELHRSPQTVEELQEMAQKRQLSRERENEEMQQEEETKALQKQQAIKAVEQHRRQRDFSQSLRTSLQEAVNQPAVQTLLFEFGKSLEALFTHYSKATARLDRDPLLAVSALRLPGFKRLCLQLGVVPRLLGAEDIAVVFMRLAKSEKGVEGVLALTLDSFRQALAELAVLARPALRQVKGEAPPTTVFAQKDLGDFFEHLAITPNPKSTLVLLKRLTDPLSQGQATSTDSGSQTAKK